MPAARNMEAPDWVTEGLRAYYRVAADTVENPFRDEPVVIAPTPRAGELNSAPAIMRTDVVALASRYAATSSTIFVGQPPIPWSDVFSTGYPGICDFWVNINAVKALQMSLPAGVYTSATAYVSQAASILLFEWTTRRLGQGTTSPGFSTVTPGSCSTRRNGSC